MTRFSARKVPLLFRNPHRDGVSRGTSRGLLPVPKVEGSVGSPSLTSTTSDSRYTPSTLVKGRNLNSSLDVAVKIDHP